MRLPKARSIVLRRTERDEQGFSLLELVVTTAILLIITAVGIAPFTPIVDSSRAGAVIQAMDDTENIIIKYALDGDEGTDPLDAAHIYNQGSSDSYGVTIDVRKVAGVGNTKYDILAIHSPYDYTEEELEDPAKWDVTRRVNT